MDAMHRRKFLAMSAAIIPAWGGFATGRASGAPGPGIEPDPEITKLLDEIRTKHQVPALAASVSDCRQLLGIGAVGVRKAGDETPVTIHDRFHLGSDTKAMTSALLARMVEAGKLEWTTTLPEAFPNLRAKIAPSLRPVTIEQVLSHRAGLAANVDQSKHVAIFAAGDVRAQRRKIAELVLTSPPEKPPGAGFLYSNLDYIVMGALAERIGRAPWEDLIRRDVFEPLGMTEVGFGPMGTPGKVDQPWQHDGAGKPIGPGPFSDNPPYLGPAGRCHASLGDWAKFARDQLAGARGEKGLLLPATYKTLQAPYPADGSYTPGGWGVAKIKEGRVLAHDGSNTMSYARAFLVPEIDRAFLVACNSGAEAAKDACHETVAALLARHRKS